MLTLNFRERDNWRTMVRIERDLEDGVEKAVQTTAEEIVADIRSNWSAVAPSVQGNPPAIRSGVLDRSVVADKQGRDLLGHFSANKDAKVWFVRVDTAPNDDRGYNYAPALEDPDYLDRPFLSSALERAAGYYTSNIKRFVRL